MSSINRAAFLDGVGTPVRVADAPLPVPGPNDVLIKNHAVAINPVDWKIQTSGFGIVRWPSGLGSDVAGEVAEVGSEVTRFKRGDRVFGHSLGLRKQTIQECGFALYTAVPETVVARMPDGTSYAEASVLPLALDTAATGLYKPAAEGYLGLEYPSLTPTQSGKVLLVWGASSSVGAVTVQLAIASGVTVFATASAHNHDLVTSLGVAEVFDYSSPAVVTDIVAAIKATGETFAGVYDAISTPDSIAPVFEIVQQLGGANVALSLPAPKEVPEGIKIGQVFGVDDATHAVWREYVTPALEQGKLKCVPEAFVVGKGLEHVQEGMDLLKKGVSAKKVVVEL